MASFGDFTSAPRFSALKLRPILSRTFLSIGTSPACPIKPNATVNFTAETLDSIVTLLGARREALGSDTVLYIESGGPTPAIVLTIASLDKGASVISAQTIHGYFELHDVDRVVPVETGEVIFVAERDDRISGLVVGKEGTCSLFSNVARATISADFTTLEPPLLLAAMQLGLAENIPA